MRLAGKIALVTGGASGFGAGIARTFAREGAKVAILDVNGQGAKEVASSIGANARAIQGDVTEFPQIAADHSQVSHQTGSAAANVTTTRREIGCRYATT